MSAKNLSYPAAIRTDYVGELTGHPIQDPYHWMGNPVSGEVRNWLSDQEKLTRDFLSGIKGRSDVMAVLNQMPVFVPDRLPVFFENKRYYFGLSLDGKGQAIFCDNAGTEECVFDPATRKNTAHFRLDPDFTTFSPGGRYIAIGFAEAGADIHTVRIWDVNNSDFLPEILPLTINPVVAWQVDESGFYYNRTRSKILGGKDTDGIYFHRLNSAPEQDRLIYDYTDGLGHAVLPYISEDGQYLFLKTLNFVTQKAGLLVRPVTSDEAFLVLFGDMTAPVNILGLQGDILYVETYKDAPNGCVLSLDFGTEGRVNWREVVPESEYALARSTHSVSSCLSCVCGDYLVLTYLVDASHQLRIFSLEGSPINELRFPDFVTVLAARPLRSGSGVEMAVTSFLHPYKEYEYTFDDNRLHVRREVESGLDVTNIEIGQQFYPAADGTQIPMFLAKSRGSQDSPGPVPVLMYGYGGWGSAISPGFRADMLAWLAIGGSYVIANIRGGGEYGSDWHNAGRKLNKINCFSDFEAAAEHLIREGITKPGGLAIRGLSNGGLLVTACLNRRPDLFAAVIAEVPLVDVIHLMDTPIGPAISAELGNPAQDEETFEYMLSYSPLQNVQANPDRPSILIVPGENDERVLPCWIYKYVAEMQATVMSDQAVLMRLVPGEGHVDWPWGVTKDVYADELAFLLARIPISPRIERKKK